MGCAGLGPLADYFLDYGFVRAELGYDGDEASVSCRGGDAAVGGVVAEPDDLGDGGVECGEVEGGDVAGGAVDHEPGAGLPGPAWGLGGEGVVDAEGTADDEGAVGDVVDLAYGPLFLDAVDYQRADAEGRIFFILIGCGGFWRRVRDVPGGAQRYGMDFGSGQRG